MNKAPRKLLLPTRPFRTLNACGDGASAPSLPCSKMVGCAAVAMFLFSGCAFSPTLDVYGSYFPAWIVCIVIGIVLTVIVRLLLVGGGINEHLRFKPALYCCMMIFFTLAVWLIFFKG